MFGAISHGDDAARAVTFSAEVIKDLKDCCIGISSGKDFIGTLGGNTRREYVVMGSSVNMSARLMGQAMKRMDKDPVVLVDERTRQAAASKCSFSKLDEPIVLKGVKTPQTVYKVVKEQQVQHDVS